MGHCSTLRCSKLIDEDHLAKEVHKLSPTLFTSEKTRPQASHAACEELLQKWMRAIAVSKGIDSSKVDQMVTKPIIEAILDEPEHHLIEPAADITASLQERLIHLGCNKQFSSLCAEHTVDTNAINGEFVTILLAYLASRVFAPFKRCRR